MSLKTIQEGLNGLGYDAGAADGDWGPKTESALRACIAFRGQRVATSRPPMMTSPPSGVAAPKLYQGSARYLVDEIVVHCSATQPDWMDNRTLAAKVTEIRRWHVQDRKWRDIGYHWIIDRDGDVAPGRPETEIGAGVEGHNRRVIHVCLIGGHGSAKTDRFGAHFTSEQDAALRQIIAQISARTPIKRISGHNEWAEKACPGFNVPAWLAKRVSR
jgi:peptidoglycan hydrolase-like protein with peptidoglycan-binding domain